MTSNSMSSRGGKPRLRQCPASTKDKPQSGRSPGSRVTAFAPPSQFYGHPFFQWHLEQKLAGYSCGNSAGFPPASLLSTLSRRPGACGGVRRVLDGGQGGGASVPISFAQSKGNCRADGCRLESGTARALQKAWNLKIVCRSENFAA